MLINVTQEDIDNGKTADAVSCPIALAINRATGAESSVVYRNVDIYDLKRKVWFFFTVRENKHGIKLPNRVSTFIRNFDMGGPTDPYVKPFSFELDI